jgi:aspartyl-tRNA(Asn)/glutamyl-tRNA(Gln) amidotransferase subunit C
MKIDREILNKTAHLARLEFDETNAEKMMQDMTNMLNWVEKLHEVDTLHVEPLTTMSHEINSFRDDLVGEHLRKEDALKSAAKSDVQYFRVPKVLE